MGPSGEAETPVLQMGARGSEKLTCWGWEGTLNIQQLGEGKGLVWDEDAGVKPGCCAMPGRGTGSQGRGEGTGEQEG